MTGDTLVAHVLASSAVIVGLSLVLGWVARRLGQPEVIGQILGGIALGPSLLGRIAPGVSSALFPSAVTPYLNVIAQLALLFFLFAVAYELDLRVLRRQRRVVPLVSLSAFSLPMLLGAASVILFPGQYQWDAGDETSRVTLSLFMAVALSITAVPVLAGIIAERNMSGALPSIVAMASAGLIDAVGWLSLTAVLFFAGTTSSAGTGLLMTVVLFTGYLIVMVLVVRPALQRWLRRPGATARYDVPLVVTMAMASAWVTASLGLHVIFGAFLAGLIMPRTADGEPDAHLHRPLQETGALLLPLFFIISGRSVDITALHGSDLPLLGLVCALAVVGKFGGGLFGARLAGLGPRDATVVGVLLNTRGLTEFIALNIGLQEGIIDQRLYTVLVVMALLTTALTTPLLQLMKYPTPGRDQPEPVRMLSGVSRR